MLIKDSGDTGHTVKALRKLIAKRKVAFSIIMIVGYTLGVMAVSSFMLKHGFWGTYLKPWVHKNVDGVVDYISSWSAHPERITLDIKQKDVLKLAHKREQALAVGTLYYSPDDDWVPAKLTYHDKTHKIKIRLKGTRDSHWEHEDFWSYKIKIKGDGTWRGMRRFAIQGPHNRNYLNEWMFQKMYGYAGVISLRYDFIQVTINGKEHPIYAVEENFDSKLIEHNQRREGPIFRAHLAPPFSTRPIQIYNSEKYKKDKALINQVYSAESLIEAYRQGELPASEVFDIDLMAKTLALCDLAGSFHALSYENMRFYYNPVTGKIEPIPYDNQHITNLNDSQLIGEGHWVSAEETQFLASRHAHRSPHRNLIWVFQLFQDRKFYEAYIRQLAVVSDKEFLDSFLNSIRTEKEEALKTLYTSFPQYQFTGEEILYANQNYIKNRLRPQKAVLAYWSGQNQESIFLDVANKHSLGMEVAGLVVGDGHVFPVANPVALPAKRIRGGPLVAGTNDLKNYYEAIVSPLPESGTGFQRIEFKIPAEFEWTEDMKSHLKIQTRVLGASHSLEEIVVPWNLKSDLMRKPSNVDTFEFLSRDEQNKVIRIKEGQWIVQEDVVIPKGYRLVAGPGTRIQLTRQAKILSYSPLEFQGTPDHPVRIDSEDYSGQGIVVIGAEQQSVLQHVVLSRLSNPGLGGWLSSGAITFYESPVSLTHVRIENNKSEDALNIIRSEFKMDHVTFQNIHSDAFDSDFSNGTIKHVIIRNSGNDGIDVSGSRVVIDDMWVDGVGDKGVSAGENSEVKIKSFRGKNSKILIASKDLSRIDIENASMRDSKYGFAVYQKKSEFGPGTIEVQNLDIVGVQTPYVVEKGSSLRLDEKIIEGETENVKDLLYPARQ